MSASGSYDPTPASYVWPSASTVTLSEPATTCAFDITRLGATTKPLPSNTFWHPGATPRILTTLGRVAATTASLASAASGASTAMIGVRPYSDSTSGRADVSSSADRRGGSTSSCASSFEPRTAAARFGWSDLVSGVANIHAATSTATSCSPTPIT